MLYYLSENTINCDYYPLSFESILHFILPFYLCANSNAASFLSIVKLHFPFLPQSRSSRHHSESNF